MRQVAEASVICFRPGWGGEASRDTPRLGHQSGKAVWKTWVSRKALQEASGQSLRPERAFGGRGCRGCREPWYLGPALSAV